MESNNWTKVKKFDSGPAEKFSCEMRNPSMRKIRRELEGDPRHLATAVETHILDQRPNSGVFADWRWYKRIDCGRNWRNDLAFSITKTLDHAQSQFPRSSFRTLTFGATPWSTTISLRNKSRVGSCMSPILLGSVVTDYASEPVFHARTPR